MFYSIATIIFYSKYGIGIYGNSNITRTCVSFSVLYLVYFLGLMIFYVLTSKVDKYKKW
jgi:hypothetical protein